MDLHSMVVGGFIGASVVSTVWLIVVTIILEHRK